MTRRVIVVAIVVAAVLVFAVPALAFNGMRGDYTTTQACQSCHAGTAGIPPVYNQWVHTKHAIDEAAGETAARLPYGSVCTGCHTANYDPTKVTPVPIETSTSGDVSWGASPSAIASPQTQGDAAFSEEKIGCSSCHYGANVTGGLAIYGVDSNDTAHNAPLGLMANADICGACHSRYSYTVDTFAVNPIPTPTAKPTTLIQPQMALGYPMLGSPSPSPATGWLDAAPLSTYLNIPAPGWTPTPTATVAGLGKLQTYWLNADGSTTMWQQTGHDGSAAQYPEWASERHANALNVLTSEPFWAFLSESDKQGCLECHSADFRIMKEAGKTVTSADVKYGVTCVGCHTPHAAGTAKGVWDEEFDTQLITDSAKTLCTTCHNAEIPAGQQATPGEEIHHPMKEMMDGYGAIGVPKMPSVHKGKCVQCHMPPTSYSRGSVQLGGNHTFNIIEPEVAAKASPIPIRTTTPDPSADPVVEEAVMPYSACSTCHERSTDPLATYLQDTIEQRQEWTTEQLDAINADLETAAGKLGFADSTSAKDAIVAIPESSWTSNQRHFLDAYTNHQFVESEGSYGIHNWAYSVAIIDKSQEQVQSVTSDRWLVSLKASKKSVMRNRKVRFRGTVTTSSLVAATGSVRLQKKRAGGSWANWKMASLSSGSYSKAIRMKSKGTWYVRAKMAGNASNLKAYSKRVKVVVK